MSITKIPVRTVFDNAGIPIGLAEFQAGEVVPIVHGGTSANTATAARENLGIGDSNIRSLLSASGSINYDNSTGIFSFTQGNTDTIVEGVSNLYFSNARAVASLVGQTVTIGDATVTGNLFVLGNVVQFNTETLTVEDKNILLANGSSSSAASNGAGITIDGANANLIYLSDGDKWSFNKNLEVNGNSVLTIGSSTTDLQEGSNLYFTNARSVGALTAGEGVDIAANGLVTVTVTAGTKFSNANVNITFDDLILFSFDKNLYKAADFWLTIDDGTNFKNIKNIVLHNGSSLTYTNTITSLGTLDVGFVYEFDGDNIILKLPATGYVVINYFGEEYTVSRIVNVTGIVNFLEV